MKWTNSNKAVITILIILAITITLTLILVFNIRSVDAYGIINNEGIIYTMDVEVVNCEISDKDYIITNSWAVSDYNQERIMINGIALFNYITVMSINTTYDPKIACYQIHESDINPEPIDYSITAGESELIEYNITNNQDQRLFYECTITTNCAVTRKFYSNYINPGAVQVVHFNITCPAGVHESIIETIFVDELVNYHTVVDNLVITAT